MGVKSADTKGYVEWQLAVLLNVFDCLPVGKVFYSKLIHLLAFKIVYLTDAHINQVFWIQQF